MGLSMESTATRLAESGNGVRVRIASGWMKGWLATLTPSGQVWVSSGLTHLTEADTEPAWEGDV